MGGGSGGGGGGNGAGIRLGKPIGPLGGCGGKGGPNPGCMSCDLSPIMGSRWFNIGNGLPRPRPRLGIIAPRASRTIPLQLYFLTLNKLILY